MLRIPKIYSHIVYGLVQSGLTCAVASAVSNYAFLGQSSFFIHWLRSWLISWVMFLPVVFLAAPYIRNFVKIITYDPINYGSETSLVHRQTSEAQPNGSTPIK